MIIDGSVGGEAIGPLSADPVYYQTIIVSNDVVMGDSIAAQMIGYNPLHDVVNLNLKENKSAPGDIARRIININLMVLVAIGCTIGYYLDGYIKHSRLIFELSYLATIIAGFLAAARMKSVHFETLSVFFALTWPLNTMAVHGLAYLVGIDQGASEKKHLLSRRIDLKVGGLHEVR